MLITLVSFLIVLAIIIIAHEFGHFFTAKLFHVKVEEFSLGFPPRLFSVRRGETKYSLSAVPLGGFVKMAGEEDPNVLGSLAGKGILPRLAIISAGPLMNFLLPVLLLSIAFMIPHNQIIGQVAVTEVATNSPAAISGITPGDIVLSINGKEVHNAADLQRNIHLSLGEQAILTLEHSDSTTEDIAVIPRWRPPKGQGAIGIVIKQENPAVVRESSPFWKAIPMGIVASVEALGIFKNRIMMMILGSAPIAITGPVGIAQITGEFARIGIVPLLEFAAFLSINLGIINMFPIPALDGGRIAFILIEAIRRGRRVSPKVERLVHSIGFILLIAAILTVTCQDILRIINGESLLP
jgi:regulator of sigma E protease